MQIPLTFLGEWVYFLLQIFFRQLSLYHYPTVNNNNNQILEKLWKLTVCIWLLLSSLLKLIALLPVCRSYFEGGRLSIFLYMSHQTGRQNMICSPKHSCDIEGADNSVIMMLSEVGGCSTTFFASLFSMKRMILFFLSLVLPLQMMRSLRYGLVLILDIHIEAFTGDQTQTALLGVTMYQIINSIDEEIWTAKKWRKMLPPLLRSKN